MENINFAIQEWRKVEAEESAVSKVEEDLVAVSFTPQHLPPAIVRPFPLRGDRPTK